jgi:putative hydrolase
VLGQYELALLQPESPPRLLFVATNLQRAVAELGVDRESFLRWVAIHELTHALQFGGVGWLRAHLGGLLRSYLETVEVRIERGSAGGLPSLPNLAELVERFREGGLAALVQTGEQRTIVDRMQAAMAMIEGHAEHLMDALAPALVPRHEGLREAM